uniref:Uncharacterized protein n=1 Tax=uncultured Chloroflexota bacterium TaxID=166587 RepID=H5SDX1_9CHLR|nr:hypothetical protein HGMM_F14G08C07 [uncultured Chloroflexota bacterium]
MSGTFRRNLAWSNAGILIALLLLGLPAPYGFFLTAGFAAMSFLIGLRLWLQKKEYNSNLVAGYPLQPSRPVPFLATCRRKLLAGVGDAGRPGIDLGFRLRRLVSLMSEACCDRVLSPCYVVPEF